MATSTLAKPNIRTHLFLVVADLKTLLFTRGGGPYTPTVLRLKAGIQLSFDTHEVFVSKRR